MRYVNVFMLLLVVAALAAVEAQVEPVEELSSSSGLVTAGIALVGTIMTWLFALLRKKVKTGTEVDELAATESLWSQRNLLLDQRVTPFAISVAEQWIVENIAPIMIDATDGNGFRWSDHISVLRTYVKDRVLKKFASENVDILEHLVENELDSLIDRNLTKLIGSLPVSVQAFLPAAALESLREYAISYASDKAADLIK